LQFEGETNESDWIRGVSGCGGGAGGGVLGIGQLRRRGRRGDVVERRRHGLFGWLLGWEQRKLERLRCVQLRRDDGLVRRGHVFERRLQQRQRVQQRWSLVERQQRW
jgi:hypothetical protein